MLNEDPPELKVWWFSLGVTYADNFVLCLESVDEVMGKYDKLEEALEKKGLYAKYFIWYTYAQILSLYICIDR